MNTTISNSLNILLLRNLERHKLGGATALDGDASAQVGNRATALAAFNLFLGAGLVVFANF